MLRIFILWNFSYFRLYPIFNLREKLQEISCQKKNGMVNFLFATFNVLTASEFYVRERLILL